MGTLPQSVKIGISATDETAPAFATAQAKVRAFQTEVAGSFTQARGAAHLFSEEIGLGLNRELVRAAAGSALLQGALSAALPAGLAIGFAAAAYKVWENLSGAKEAAKELGERVQLAESFHKVAEEIGRIQAGIKDIGKTSQEIATHAMVEAQFNIVSLQARQSMMREMERSVNSGAQPSRFAGGIMLHTDQAMAAALGSASDRLGPYLAKAQALFDKTVAEMGQSFRELGDKAVASAAAAHNAWVQSMDAASKSSSALLSRGETPADKELKTIRDQVDVWEKIRQSHAGINAIANEYIEKLGIQAKLIKQQEDSAIALSLARVARQNFSDAVSDPSLPLYSGTRAAMNLQTIQNDQNAAIQAAQDIYEQTRTKAQAYSDTIAQMSELLDQGRISQQQFAVAAMQAGAKMDSNTKYFKQFGAEIGRNLEGAITFQESWKRALQSVLQDLVKLILQLYVFRSLANSFGGAGGGFLGSLFSGMAGHGYGGGGGAGSATGDVSSFSGMFASGGSIRPGMWGLVGEAGPELAYGGSSGLSISPNGALGRQIVQHFDLRGAIVTDDVVRRAELAGALRFTEDRAALKGANIAMERQLRR